MTQAVVQKKTYDSVKAMLYGNQDAIAKAAPGGVSVEYIFRTALNSVAKTPKLQECTPESLFLAIVQGAILGLECDGPMNEASLVPFKDKVTFMPQYGGYMKLGMETGLIDDWYVDIIYEGDEYDIQRGDKPTIMHKPKIGPDRGNPIIFYSVVVFKTGRINFEYMTQAEVDEIRKRSKAASNGPWQTDPLEMGKKTIIRRHRKRLPLGARVAKAAELENQMVSGESQDLSEAINIVGAVVSDATPASPIEQPPAPVAEEPKPLPVPVEEPEPPQAPPEPDPVPWPVEPVAETPPDPEPAPEAPVQPELAGADGTTDEAPQKRKPGRPPGAKNKAKDDIVTPAADEVSIDSKVAIAVEQIGESDAMEYFLQLGLLNPGQELVDLAETAKNHIAGDPGKFHEMVRQQLGIDL